MTAPAEKSLIADVEAGKVGVILAKDMSRIGRNYLETGFYTEVVFRKHNVRFIAIANGVDNDHPETGEFVPFLNIMNEWYLKDQSKESCGGLSTARQIRLTHQQQLLIRLPKRPGCQAPLAG